jgi:uncharacterized protein (UPF0261 family)
VPAPEGPAPSVVVLGTLDSKGEECSFLARLVREHGCQPLLVDVGVFEPATDEPVAVGHEEVARRADTTLRELASGDRGRAVTAMGTGAAAVLRDLHDAGRLDAVLAIGGSGGTSIASTALRCLPLGVPKLIVSTVASGDVRRYLGCSDIAMIPSVVDISGVNQVSELVFRNAAAGVCAMAASRRQRADRPAAPPGVGATMFGVTTPCVTAARPVLTDAGYEMLTFHANGTGGQAYEAAIAQGLLCAGLDVTTTEFADTVAGGELPACAERLETAGRLGLPQVVSLGAVDVVNFGPPETVPARFRRRNLVRHNPQVTLMRADADESASIGQLIAAKLNHAAGPLALFIPLRGFSALSAPGSPFHDPAADEALRKSLAAGLHQDIEIVELDLNINDPPFGRHMAERLVSHLTAMKNVGG